MRLTAKKTHKRYANCEDYIGIREDGSETFVFGINERTEEGKLRELKSFMAVSGAVKMFKVWTATTGKCWEEVII